MHVEVIEGTASIDELKPEWRGIEAHNSSLSVFQSWSWNSSWFHAVTPEISGSGLRCFVALSATGETLAILPCFYRPMLGGMLTITQLLGHRMSFLNDIVSRFPDDDGMAQEIVTGLYAEVGKKRREIVHLRHLNGASAFTRALVATGRAEVQCRRLLIVRDAEGRDPLSRLSRKRRRDLVWRENKIRKSLSAYYHVVEVDDVSDGFDRLSRLHVSRFEELNGSSLLTGGNLHFLRAACIELCRSGVAEIVELRTEEQIIASLVCIIDQDRYYAINGGFDSSFGQFSPMKLLLTHAMRRAFSVHHCAYFELGPDYEQYKQTWQPECINSYTACLGGQGAYSKLAAACYRRAFQHVVRRAGATSAYKPPR